MKLDSGQNDKRQVVVFIVAAFDGLSTTVESLVDLVWPAYVYKLLTISHHIIPLF